MLFDFPQFDYSNVMYGQDYNELFHLKLESYQYSAGLAIVRKINGLSRKKLYQELGLETLHKRHWLRKLCRFYKIQNNKSPSYLLRLIPTTNRMHITRNSNNLQRINFKHNFFNFHL